MKYRYVMGNGKWERLKTTKPTTRPNPFAVFTSPVGRDVSTHESKKSNIKKKIITLIYMCVQKNN